MLSPRTQELVVSLFKSYIDGERQVEVVRQVLSELPSFDPYSAFRYLDFQGQGYLSHGELMRFMRENRRSMSEYEAGLVCASWSGLGSRLVTYEDFLNAVLPSSNDRLRSRAAQRSASRSLDYETTYALCRVLERELDMQVKLEEVKAELKGQRDFTHTGLFTMLDTDQDQYVNEADLTFFCRRTGVFLYPDDVKAIFYRLDKDRDGLLSYRELRGGTDSFSSPMSRSPSPQRPHGRSSSPLKPTRSSDPVRKSSEYRSTRDSKASDVRASASSLRHSKETNKNRSPERTGVMETPPKPTNPQSNQKPVPTRLSYSETSELKAVFEVYEKVLCELEREKKKLVELQDFSMKALYAVFDKEEGADVTLEDFQKGVRRVGLCPEQKDVELVFGRYDGDKDAVLKASEFTSMVCPLDRSLFDSHSQRRSKSSKRSSLSSDGMTQLMRVLRLLLDSEVELNRARYRLYGKKLNDLHIMFLEHDTDKDGFLSLSELSRLTQFPGMISARLDYDRDGRVSFCDFLHEIIP